MRLLLDTHVFLWWDDGAHRLPVRVREHIADPDNTVYVSAASVWEVAIKARLGKLDYAASPTHAVEANGFLALPITASEAELAGTLDWLHTDPFDRMLVAQARQGGLTLVTADAVMRELPGLVHLWAG